MESACGCICVKHAISYARAPSLDYGLLETVVLDNPEFGCEPRIFRALPPGATVLIVWGNDPAGLKSRCQIVDTTLEPRSDL